MKFYCVPVVFSFLSSPNIPYTIPNHRYLSKKKKREKNNFNTKMLSSMNIKICNIQPCNWWLCLCFTPLTQFTIHWQLCTEPTGENLHIRIVIDTLSPIDACVYAKITIFVECLASKMWNLKKKKWTKKDCHIRSFRLWSRHGCIAAKIMHWHEIIFATYDIRYVCMHNNLHLTILSVRTVSSLQRTQAQQFTIFSISHNRIVEMWLHWRWWRQW